MNSFILVYAFCFAIVSNVLSVETDLERLEAEIVGRLLALNMNGTSMDNVQDKNKVKRVFQCPHLSPSTKVPTSVHKLRPGDVQVVAALGDSLTAGRGASGGVIGLLVDYRGQSWSIGGDDDYEDSATLPNILRKYNPKLYGFSTGVGDREKSTARLNVARTGDESRHLVEQANLLIQRMKTDSNIDYDNDWKVVTVFIGANDLCDYCTDKEEYTSDKYKANLEAALDILHANLPKTFVNLVEVINVEIAQELAHGLLCEAIHIYACDCAANPKSNEAEEYLLKLKNEFQQVAVDVAGSGRYDTRDDFTVVLQPFYRDTYLPRTESGGVDYSYFASDCFHHSHKGQQAAAEALWNNMVEPVGKKRTEWSPGEPIECPTKDSPYLYTSKNTDKGNSKQLKPLKHH